MSAPIDDLLYGGDDSGDEDELNAMPMSSFSAPLPATSALPLVAPPAAVLGGPPPMNAASVSAPVASMAPPPAAARPLSATATPAAAATATVAGGPAPATAAAAAPVKQPGSGHQMFQQMFALLKQMLPPEQYAALHSEMRNGNGNDIKSIVDIIKRIAGDAIFASVIQRMDLTRNQSAAAGSLGIVKSEPTAAAVASSLAATSPAAIARPTPLARPVVTPPGGSLTQPVAAVPAAPPQHQQTSAPAVATAPKLAVAMQRPTLVAATPPAASATTTNAVKSEPTASITPAPVTTTTTPPSDASTTPTPAAPTQVSATSVPSGDSSSTSGASNSSSNKNDTQEKIQFAKKLLFHASSCVLPPGSCQVKRCDDVRRVFKHSVSCGGARGCSHCRQLKALVEYHAKECLVPVGEHCKIPFCDGIRKNNAAARARAVSSGALPAAAGSTPATSTPSTATPAAPAVSTTAASTASVMSDDDEDNTPLASAVTKAKKSKAKSPKSGPVSSSTASASAAAKKKASSSAKPSVSTPASNASTPSSTGSSTPALGGAAAAAKPNAGGKLTQAQEYGRLLQLILHVEKCKTSVCPVGEECVEAKSLLRQVNAPDAPVRAQTYKKVYAHYKVCVAKNNTQNCPMCKIGLLPIETTPATTPVATTSGGPQSGGASTSTSSGTSASPSAGPAVPAASPTVGALKRQNSSVASPRSPSKKPRVTVKGGKSSTDASSSSASTGAAAEQQTYDLAVTSRNDLRKEEDVLTHTGIDLSAERRAMMDRLGRKHMPERLPCKKEEWIQNDLFNNDKLTRHMELIARKHGVSLGSGPAATATTQIMAHALHEYLKQVMEEMVEAAKLRGDTSAQALDVLVKKEMGGANGTLPRELTSTDILRVSCDDSFARLRQEDLALRSHVLEDAKREELAEKERSKKRKKVDRVKLLAQEEKDEAEMDIEELAVKDLKERLLQEDKDGVVHVEGRVNESITTKFQRRVDDQVTMEDATYWLENQKPYINPKLFVRAEAARIVTKSLL